MCYVQEMCERRKGEEKNYNHTHPKVFPEWSRNGPIGILKSEQPQTCSLFSTGIVFLYDVVYIISVRHSLHPQWSMRANSADWPGSPGQGSLWHIYCVIVTQKWDAANQSERSNNRLTLIFASARGVDCTLCFQVLWLWLVEKMPIIVKSSGTAPSPNKKHLCAGHIRGGLVMFKSEWMFGCTNLRLRVTS